MDEKLESWNEELRKALASNDVARALELKGWIDARTSQLIEDMSK